MEEIKLSKKQKDIVESEANKIVVCASAASGKSRIMSERAKFLINKGIKPENMAVITFTVAAAEEMRERIGDYPSLFIGTIHGLMYRWMCDAGYKEEADLYAAKENFDLFFDFVNTHQECLRHLDALIVDEAQDTDDNMWEILLWGIEPDNFLFVGDLRQCIYQGFRNVDPLCLNKIASLDGVVTYDLNENYRNGKAILDFAKRILYKLGVSYHDNSIPMQPFPGRVTEINYSFENIVKICRQINEEDYKNWFILARTNSEVSDIVGLLYQNNIPNQRLARAGMTIEQLRAAMSNNVITVGTIHSSKGLEKDNVIVVDPRFYNAGERRVSYVAATRAIKHLIWMPVSKKKKKMF